MSMKRNDVSHVVGCYLDNMYFSVVWKRWYSGAFSVVWKRWHRVEFSVVWKRWYSGTFVISTAHIVVGRSEVYSMPGFLIWTRNNRCGILTDYKRAIRPTWLVS